MRYLVLAIGLVALLGVSGGLAYTAVRGTPTMPVFGQSLPVSVRNNSAMYYPSSSGSSRSRSGGYYYGSSSRRHYGGGYSSGK